MLLSNPYNNVTRYTFYSAYVLLLATQKSESYFQIIVICFLHSAKVNCIFHITSVYNIYKNIK